MSLYSEYDNFHPIYTRANCRKGGTNRAKTARRDKWGRMLPKDDTVSLPKPVKHGQKGGLARLSKALRDDKGRFIKG